MEDQELLNQLWERFEQIASAEGKRLATTLRDFEEKGGVDLNYHCLAMAVGMGLVAVADQPGAGEFAQRIADDLLGVGEIELSCLSGEASELYWTWQYLWMYRDKDRAALGVEADYEDSRTKARALLDI